MIMADVLTWFLIVIGALLVIVALWLAAFALFPARVEACSERYGRRPVAATLLGLVVLVRGPQRHHEPRSAEAALRAMAVDHGLLHRVQAVHGMRALVLSLHFGSGRRVGGALVLEVFDREERLAMQGRQKLDAGVDRLQLQAADGAGGIGIGGQLSDHDRAGAAVTLVAAFLGAGAVRVLAQPVEHRSGRMDTADVDDLAAMEEADRLDVVALCAHAFLARG